MIQAVIFDLDGTLLDTLGDLAGAGNHALRAMGLETHPVDAYRRMVGNGIPKLIERMLPAGSGEATRAVALELFRNWYNAHGFDVTAPYPGIPRLLERLASLGVATAVVSNKDDAMTKAIAAHYFPDHAFTAVIGRRDGVPAKPDPASVREAMAAMGRVPSECLYVGDSDVDVLTAHNAGLCCCGALWGFRGRAELEAAGADLLAATADDVLAAVLNG